jgi:protein SCO1
MRSAAAWTVCAAALALAACGSGSKAQEYELQGQVLLVDQARREITIKHGDIPRFMPGMTMAFKVKDDALLRGRMPGELVKATLVVEESDAHLRTIERTGMAPIPEGTPPPARLDVLAPRSPVADATFVDETGAARRLSDWRGKAVAVTFMYTRCPIPNFCPLMDRYFASVQEQVRRDPALAPHVQLLSVTFDPQHDTPAVLARHAQTLGADATLWRFLTGDAAAIEQFASQFGVSIAREASPEIVHNLRTAVIDPQGRLSIVLNGSEWTPADLVAELRSARDAR